MNRLDGAKMFALAALGLRRRRVGVLPRWLRYTGIALAIAMASSGVPYLSLLQGGAVLAYVSGPLLLLFITGTGIALGTSASKPSRVTEPALTHPGKTAGPQVGRPAESRVIPQTGAAKNTGQWMTPGQDAGPARPGGLAGQPGMMTVKIRRVARQLSAPLVILAAALFAAGGISGLFSYLDRSSGPGEVHPRFIGLVAATRRCRRRLRCVRLRPVAPPAEVRPPQRPPVAARAAREARRPAGSPDPRRASRPVRARPRTARRASRRSVLVLFLPRWRTGHRRPGPELHRQRLGRPDLYRCHGLPLP